ncbi:MAG TPA: tRNA pseudouridine(55) synthase TruB [Prevotellaceae bacterium]|nr:tRNA pseudouridine(55) synthase TruB [Prevotellaceae bacterium]
MDFIQGEVIPFYKPFEWTSFGIVAKVRNILSERLGTKVKIGHAGTLDPYATGVIILLTGKATKRVEEYQQHTKEYIATLKLGATTASYDREHPENATFPTEHISRELVEQTLRQFIGVIEQVPPEYSACKVNGEHAYKLIRKGKEVKLKPKTLVIEEIELLSYDKPEMQIRVVCSKGTYIRALARDIGEALHSGAYLTGLKRTRIGDIRIADCHTLEEFPGWLDRMMTNDITTTHIQTLHK